MSDLPALPSYLSATGHPRDATFIGLGSTPNLDRVDLTLSDSICEFDRRRLYQQLQEGHPIFGLRAYKETPEGRKYDSRWHYVRTEVSWAYHRLFDVPNFSDKAFHQAGEGFLHLMGLNRTASMDDDSRLQARYMPHYDKFQIEADPHAECEVIDIEVMRHTYFTSFSRIINSRGGRNNASFLACEEAHYSSDEPNGFVRVDSYHGNVKTGDIRFLKLPLSAAYRGHFNDDPGFNVDIDGFVPLRVASKFDATLPIKEQGRSVGVEVIVLQCVFDTRKALYLGSLVPTPGQMEIALSGKKGRSCYLLGNLMRFLPIPLPRGNRSREGMVTQTGSLETGNRYRFHDLYGEGTSVLKLRGITAKSEKVGEPLSVLFEACPLRLEYRDARHVRAVIYSHVVSRCVGIRQTYQPVIPMSNEDSHSAGWQLKVLRLFPEGFDALTPLLDGLNQVLKASLPSRLKQAVKEAGTTVSKNTMTWHLEDDPNWTIDPSVSAYFAEEHVRQFKNADFEVPSICHKCGTPRKECPQCQIAGRKATVCACPSTTHSVEEDHFTCFAETVGVTKEIV